MRMRILGVVVAIVAAVLAGPGGVAWAAQIIVWNLSGRDVDVVVDGVVQCTVQPRHACVVDDIPPGAHAVSAGLSRRYEEGVGKVPAGRPVELRWPNSWYKFCRFDAGLVPDECVAWVRDQANLLPGGVDAVHVAYRWRNP